VGSTVKFLGASSTEDDSFVVVPTVGKSKTLDPIYDSAIAYSGQTDHLFLDSLTTPNQPSDAGNTEQAGGQAYVSFRTSPRAGGEL
jgi:hypothetical protein